MSDLCDSFAQIYHSYKKEFQKYSLNYEVNFSLNKALEVVESIGYYEFYSEAKKLLYPDYLLSCLTNLLNLFYSNEFVFNRSDLPQLKSLLLFNQALYSE